MNTATTNGANEMTTFRMTSADLPFICSECGSDIRLHEKARDWKCPPVEVIDAARTMLQANTGASDAAVAGAYDDLVESVGRAGAGHSVIR